LINIDKSSCVGCGKCAEACPTQAIYMIGKDVFVREGLCNSCGACIEACPKKGAITMSKPSFKGSSEAGFSKHLPIYSFGSRLFQHKGGSRHRFGRRRR